MYIWLAGMGEDLYKDIADEAKARGISVRAYLRQAHRFFKENGPHQGTQPRPTNAVAKKWREWWESLSEEEKKDRAEKAARGRWKPDKKPEA